MARNKESRESRESRESESQTEEETTTENEPRKPGEPDKAGPVRDVEVATEEDVKRGIVQDPEEIQASSTTTPDDNVQNLDTDPGNTTPDTTTGTSDPTGTSNTSTNRT